VEHLAGPMRRFRSVIQRWSATLTFRYGVVVPVDHPFYVEIGRRLRTARTDADFTQVELGMAVGLSRTSITNIELGNQQPSLYTFVRICVALGQNPAELLKELPVNQDSESPKFPNDVPEVTRETLTNLSKKALSGARS
jgi:transcriptional regulator with XRE-family HTH domain